MSWELRVNRLGQQTHAGRTRTYGTYQVYLNGDEKTPDLVLVVALRNLAPELIAVARAAEEYVEAQTADGMFLMDAVRRHAERKEALDAALAALRAKIGEAT